MGLIVGLHTIDSSPYSADKERDKEAVQSRIGPLTKIERDTVEDMFFSYTFEIVSARLYIFCVCNAEDPDKTNKNCLLITKKIESNRFRRVMN